MGTTNAGFLLFYMNASDDKLNENNHFKPFKNE